jgi:hypothetical protein
VSCDFDESREKATAEGRPKTGPHIDCSTEATWDTELELQQLPLHNFQRANLLKKLANMAASVIPHVGRSSLLQCQQWSPGVSRMRESGETQQWLSLLAGMLGAGDCSELHAALKKTTTTVVAAC